jgi:hypothetical protein
VVGMAGNATDLLLDDPRFRDLRHATTALELTGSVSLQILYCIWRT